LFPDFYWTSGQRERGVAKFQTNKMSSVCVWV